MFAALIETCDKYKLSSDDIFKLQSDNTPF